MMKNIETLIAFLESNAQAYKHRLSYLVKTISYLNKDNLVYITGGGIDDPENPEAANFRAEVKKQFLAVGFTNVVTEDDIFERCHYRSDLTEFNTYLCRLANGLGVAIELDYYYFR